VTGAYCRHGHRTVPHSRSVKVPVPLWTFSPKPGSVQLRILASPFPSFRFFLPSRFGTRFCPVTDFFFLFKSAQTARLVRARPVLYSPPWISYFRRFFFLKFPPASKGRKRVFFPFSSSWLSPCFAPGGMSYGFLFGRVALPEYQHSRQWQVLSERFFW